MGCACQGGGAAADQYAVVAADGTRVPVTATSDTGTVEQARAKAATLRGAWVKKA